MIYIWLFESWGLISLSDFIIGNNRFAVIIQRHLLLKVNPFLLICGNKEKLKKKSLGSDLIKAISCFSKHALLGS